MEGRHLVRFFEKEFAMSVSWTKAQREKAKREEKTLFSIAFTNQYVKFPAKGAGEFIEYTGQCDAASVKKIEEFIIDLLKKHKADAEAEETSKK